MKKESDGTYTVSIDRNGSLGFGAGIKSAPRRSSEKPAARARATAGFSLYGSSDLRRRDRYAALPGDRLHLWEEVAEARARDEWAHRREFANPLAMERENDYP